MRTRTIRRTEDKALRVIRRVEELAERNRRLERWVNRNWDWIVGGSTLAREHREEIRRFVEAQRVAVPETHPPETEGAP